MYSFHSPPSPAQISFPSTHRQFLFSTVLCTVFIPHHPMHSCLHFPPSHVQFLFSTGLCTLFIPHNPLQSFHSPLSHTQNAPTTIPKTSCRFPPSLRFRQEATRGCQQTTKLDKKEKNNRLTMMDFTLHPQ